MIISESYNPLKSPRVLVRLDQITDPML